MAPAPAPSSLTSLRTSTPSSLLALFLVAAFLSVSAAAYQLGGARGWGKKVGGWIDIPDAASNQDLRELGRFSVDEYNHELRVPGESTITFSGVLSGRRQVVSGFKYNLRISAVDSDTSRPLAFDAVIFVRPWISGRNRDLLSFTPRDDDYHLHYFV